MKELSIPRESQVEVLRDILNQLEPRYDLHDITSFQKDFPLQTYEDFEHSPLRIPKENVLFYETTSGSSGHKKQIPYNRALLKSFTKMFSLWLYDVLKSGPRFQSAKLFFSITPQFSKDHQSPINDDSDYLTGPLKFILTYLSVVPHKIKKIKNPKIYQHVLALYLIRSHKLEVISVWSPSFLIELFKYIEEHVEELTTDLNKSTYHYGDVEFILPKMNRDFHKDLISKNLKVTALFPNLKMISCWGSAHAASLIEKIQHYCPQAYIQEKGLLATEAPLSIPLIKAHSNAPLLNEVFYEFIDSDNKIFLLHQLKVGVSYELVITQKSGLIRYRMNDLIYVDGIFQKTPTFKFLGRTNDYCDLVGEKFNASFLNAQFTKYYSKISLSLLPSKIDGERPFYTLLSDKDLDILKTEELLKENPHYKNARALNQLGPLNLIAHKDMDQFIREFYFSKRNISFGDQKVRVLHQHEYNGELLKEIKERVAI
ncbi:MAG: GH3 auxin-responsive promoter family protein [Bacteriovoracaceae bacterium]|nr:GH3 auxin-responsive promoter family protein [Bacteriovoracaceae bacterium]